MVGFDLLASQMDRYLTPLCLSLVLYAIYRRCTRTSLSRVRGPKSTSFLFGNLAELYQDMAGEAEFRWKNLYGNSEDQLVVADPKALSRIFVTAAYQFPKVPERRILTFMMLGKSVLWADGDVHKRQRKILNPGFGGAESRAFLVVSQASAQAMVAKWMEFVEADNSGKIVMDIPSWVSRAALDAIGEGAFDVRLGSLENSESPLAKNYQGLLLSVFGSPSALQIFIQEAIKYIPTSILEYWVKYAPVPRATRLREAKKVTTATAATMVTEKAESLLQGKGGRDIFSLLVKANMDAEAKNKLSDEELYSQMRVILFAGHETTSNSIGWALLEMSRAPEIQSRLRSEIRQHKSAVRARGDTQFTASDLDNMPYLNAVVKETLRYHCVLPQVFRMASQDYLLPLSQPITTESGELMHEILVPKGTQILASVAAYNRNKDMWGEDADVFNPDRWLDGIAKDKKEAAVGVYSSLLTFGGGPRACLGWRFAVIEIQAFLVEIINQFEVSLTEKAMHIRRESSLVMVPTVDGEVSRGVQLPLAISVAPRDDDAY
ncbi:cytochrome P450 [Pisolithus orientalis]|uniref:cytochrome P450 n=1 Tax=Pisolithus orientalis TaxID=936130 RepID=UPI002224C4C3|nr:cytochrome P450 [Pisolithus orientalis]KAI6007546.1 cytochrome P450 [Pisolithus orientalis]